MFLHTVFMWHESRIVHWERSEFKISGSLISRTFQAIKWIVWIISFMSFKVISAIGNYDASQMWKHQIWMLKPWRTWSHRKLCGATDKLLMSKQWAGCLVYSKTLTNGCISPVLYPWVLETLQTWYITCTKWIAVHDYSLPVCLAKE